MGVVVEIPVSSKLLVNFIETASTCMSGIVFFINVRINVESIPPLKAIHVFLTEEVSNCLLRVLTIIFSINLMEFSSCGSLKSFEVFLGKFGVIDGSYLNVRIFVTEEGCGIKELDSTTEPSKN